MSSIFGGNTAASFQPGVIPLNFYSPTLTGYNPQNAVNQSQVASGINRANNTLAQQQAFVNATRAQNGLSNQSNVYRQQQALANQLGAMAQGAGPNPALAQLNQTTGQNIANQAALLASQRGANANPALIGRQIAQQGAAAQQEAVGQAAALRAQQQLNAISALQGQQQALGNTAAQQVGNYQSALGTDIGATQAQQNALLSQLQSQNQNALAAAQLGNQSQLQAQQNVTQQNAVTQGAVSNLNNVMGQLAGVNTQTQGNIIGGLINGVTGAIGAAVGGKYKGGKIESKHNYDDGGIVEPAYIPPQIYGKSLSQGLEKVGSNLVMAGKKAFQPANKINEKSAKESDSDLSVPEHLNKMVSLNTNGPMLNNVAQAIMNLGQIGSKLFKSKENDDEGSDQSPEAIGKLAHGGAVVPAMVSPGEKFLTPTEIEAFLKSFHKEEAVKKLGKVIPGKAKVKGDSEKNDTVPALLQNKGIVIPRSKMQQGGKAQAEFILALESKKKKNKK